MLHHINLNIAFQSIFSNSMLHNDTRIKASKVSYFSTTCLGNTKDVVLLREYENLSNMILNIYTTRLSNIDGMK